MLPNFKLCLIPQFDNAICLEFWFPISRLTHRLVLNIYNLYEIKDVTGPQNATRGLLTVYDIFGYGTQTIQGADIIASQLEILVIIPDLFDGKPLDGSVYPPDTEEKKKALGAFFQSGPGQFEPALEKVRSLAQAFKTDFKSVERWGIMGLCWGGKVR